MTSHSVNRGLPGARLFMVLSSFAPLFLLLAIRGTPVIPSFCLEVVCGVLIVVPTLVLCLRVRAAFTDDDRRALIIGTAEDSRDQMLVYLLAVLLPLYADPLDTVRPLVAEVLAFALVAFLFWKLDLHYVNVLFVAFGYRVFTVDPPDDNNPVSGRARFVLFTRRSSLKANEHVTAYRISDTVYLEAGQ